MNNIKPPTKNPYIRQVLDRIPAILSMQDRNPLSKTYGCFDRNFWCWKFTDFPGARFQEGIFPLAFLYTFPFEGNTLYDNDQVLEWISAAFKYWAQLQHKNGSFDEAYPCEQSLAATAFTSLYLGEAYELVGEKLPDNLRSIVLAAFERAGNWLLVNDERHGILSNHRAAAALALNIIGAITRSTRFAERERYFLSSIYTHQSSEGWFEEYGGADPGYQTQCLFYLTRYWQRTGDNDLLAHISQAVEFQAFCIHPDHTLGGEYGSRNTSFYFPAAFEILADVMPSAASIASFMRDGIERGDTIGVHTMDMYNIFPLSSSYLIAANSYKAKNVPTPNTLPFTRTFTRVFKDAGIYIHSTDAYYAIIGISKGGILKIFDKKTGALRYSDCGYWARSKRGATYSSQSLDRTRRASFHDDNITISSQFTRVTARLFSPGTFILFRLINITACRIASLAICIKDMLVRTLVLSHAATACTLTRSVSFHAHRIEIHDILENATAEDLMLYNQDRFTTIHMGSSHYFQPSELLMNKLCAPEAIHLSVKQTVTERKKEIEI